MHPIESNVNPAFAPAFDALEAIGAAQTAAMRLGRAVLAHEIAEALEGPGTALEKLHAVARICEREAR